MTFAALSGGPNLTNKIDFWGHLSTFGAENKPKSGPFKSENNSQTPPEPT